MTTQTDRRSEPSTPERTPEISLAEVLELLDLKPAAEPPAPGAPVYRFTGRAQAQPADRVFGGLLLAQALACAGRAANPMHQPFSLQAEFLAGASSEHELDWEVEPLAVGSGMSTLRSTLRGRDGTAVFTATSRWGAARADLPSHTALRPLPAPAPETLPDLEDRFGSDERIPLWWRMRRPVLFRHADPPAYAEAVHPPQEHQSAWVRARGHLPDDPVLRAAMVAYVSDMSLVEPVFRACGATRHGAGSRILSLSHTIAFHEVPDLSQWHQFDARAQRLAQGRALGVGELFDVGGRHVASVSQLAAVKFA